jgi:hypothetical protein
MIRINGERRGGDGRSRPVRRWSRAGRHPIAEQRFAAATQLAILARVPVLLGETITPDLLNEDARLYEWSDAEPRQPGEARPDGDARKATSR